ncbi:Aldehyde/histidinol dehydrogenase, partial [Obelidium mucronatum]
MPTSLLHLEEAVTDLRNTFDSNKTKDVSWRKEQLSRLYQFLEKQEHLMTQALKKDLRRSDVEASGEIAVLFNECVEAYENVAEWSKSQSCRKSLATLTDRVETRMEPLGVVLIIAPWNYPIQLLLGPLIAAISAGCCVVLKPSEIAPAAESLFLEWIPKVFDSSAIRIVSGGVRETTRLLELKFDHIFYTGSGQIGKIVMAAAAKQLTPVTLELGGKSPVYVHHDVDPIIAGRRLAWAKTINAGQVCIAPDYVMVHTRLYKPMIESLKSALTEMFTLDPQKSPEYARIINKQHMQRLLNVLMRQLALGHCKLEIGGESDLNDKFIAPTVVSGVRLSDPFMEDEIFGPLLGVIEVKDENEAISIIRGRERPLALYIITESKTVANKILDNTISGVSMVNDYILNMIVEEMPFGGVGASGMGSYHGHHGF